MNFLRMLQDTLVNFLEENNKGADLTAQMRKDDSLNNT